MFKLKPIFSPQGDQAKAIEELLDGLRRGYKYQTLLGVTGSGKTFTMANIIAKYQKPTLIISHNKTLAAQLAAEFKRFFPENRVEYFVSYYDYYQPEAYIPQTDTYIEKDADINEEIDKLRHSATRSLFERKDVIVVASVSCIYGLGNPEEYRKRIITILEGEAIERKELIRHLVGLFYERNDINQKRGTFRVRGDTLEIFPVYSDSIYRIEFFGNEIERITEIDPITRKKIRPVKEVSIFAAKHFITSPPALERAIKNIKRELKERLKGLRKEGKLLEAERLEKRTNYDLEMLQEVGYCTGIENYSRHLSGRAPGEPPATLLDYFPDDFLMFIDESHVTIPQLKGMYRGDFSRKKNLIDHGFRLPSAFDNRPLYFEEFLGHINQVIFVSATPGDFELKVSQKIVEQIIRPTGLVDPKIEVRPSEGQIDDLISEIKKRVKKHERVLVTTLTKRMAEDLSSYLLELGIKVNYLHSEISTIDRVKILRGLREGTYDVIVGVNLLREGLDLPEVTLVAILDADKEGFLRGERALIQTMGRSARNVNGMVILYADRLTDSMRKAISETERRRKIQLEYNKKHGITPETIRKEITDITELIESETTKTEKGFKAINVKRDKKTDIENLIDELYKEMMDAARDLNFEKAAFLRDEIKRLKKEGIKIGKV